MNDSIVTTAAQEVKPGGNYVEIGKREGMSNDEIEEYKAYLDLFEKLGIPETKDESSSEVKQ